MKDPILNNNNGRIPSEIIVSLSSEGGVTDVLEGDQLSRDPLEGMTQAEINQKIRDSKLKISKNSAYGHFKK